MENPANLQVQLTTLVSNNAFVNDVLLAAPGVGLRYRVWGVSLSRDRIPSPPTTIFQGALHDGAVNVCGRMSTTIQDGMQWQPFPGGVVWPVNTQIIWRHRDSANGDTFYTEVLYTIEAI